MNQPINNEALQIKAQLLNSQSRSFEMLSQTMFERDNLKNTITQYEKIMNDFAKQLGLENTSPQSISLEITRLKKLIEEIKVTTKKSE